MGRLVAVDPMPVLGALGVRRMTYAVGDGDDERWVRTVASHSDDELTTDDEALVYDAGPSAAAIIPRLFPGGLVLHSDHRVSEGEGNPFVYMIAPTLCLMGYAWFLMDRLGISSPPGM
jgi:hypothetical protein